MTGVTGADWTPVKYSDIGGSNDAIVLIQRHKSDDLDGNSNQWAMTYYGLNGATADALPLKVNIGGTYYNWEYRVVEKNADGESNVPVNYTVSGEDSSTYTPSGAEATSASVLTNTEKPRQIRVAKIWTEQDSTTAEFRKPVTLRLYSDDTALFTNTETVKVGDAEKTLGIVKDLTFDGEADETETVAWTGLVKDLPVYKTGSAAATTDNEAAYYVREITSFDYNMYQVPSVEAITATRTTDTDGTWSFTAANTSTWENKTSLTVTKNWDDQNNMYGLRPASITVELQMRYIDKYGHVATKSNWTDVETKTLSGDNSVPSTSNVWSATFDNLKLKIKDTAGTYGAEGEIYNIQYRVVEKTASGDVATELKSYTLATAPADDAARTTSADGMTTSSATETQTDSFTKDDADALTAHSTTELKNTMTTDTKTLKVEKRWNAATPSDYDGYAVTVQLYSDNMYPNSKTGTWTAVTGTEQTLSSANSFAYTYEKLPVANASGETIRYAVRETAMKNGSTAVDLSGFVTEYYRSADDGATYVGPYTTDQDAVAAASATGKYAVEIVNTPLTASVEATKNWAEDANYTTCVRRA